jgi:hypothetical protein
MKEFQGETFRGLYDRGGKLRIEEMRFTGCIFDHCALSLTTDKSRMSEIRAVELVDCRMNCCESGPMILSDVTVNKLRMTDLLIVVPLSRPRRSGGRDRLDEDQRHG